MISYVKGDILLDPSSHIVIPVNCVGVTGAGLAKTWASHDPSSAMMYQTFCADGYIKMGGVTVLVRPISGLYWVLFPTKNHWREASRLPWITIGLRHLLASVKVWDVRSLAIPALGCGLGGLFWGTVKTQMETILEPLRIPVTVYLPGKQIKW